MITSKAGTRLGAVVLAWMLCASPSATAQANVGVEGTYHIHGGTVVVGDGQVLEGATVLLQNGSMNNVEWSPRSSCVGSRACY